MELKTMEAQETTALGLPPKDLSHNVKRKRTKRQRPQSPISFTIPMQYSSSYGGDNFVNSTTTEEEEIFPDSVVATEEEEDTAKCLLLLSQGHYSVKQNYDIHFGSTNKFSSKRYLETHTTPNGNKAGIYVYECKTCSRTFPSFQALGGHRASHKKPKGNAVILSDDEDHPIKPSFKRNSSTSSLSLQLSNRPGPFINNNFKSSPKVHECAICGAEFTSGQALGGHMRRHRGVLPSATTNTTLSLSSLPSPRAIEIDQEESMKSNGINLSLDLNLPAAHEDDREPAQFSLPLKQQQQKQKQSPLSFSTAPTLVDCHN